MTRKAILAVLLTFLTVSYGAVTPPDAVRVWTGFTLDAISEKDFVSKLATIFMPSTIEVAQPLGLSAYQATITPFDPASLPHLPNEVALVWYQSQEVYSASARSCVAGRMYQLLHSTLFNFTAGAPRRSTSAFPTRFDGTVEAGSPYYLYGNHADWQNGTTNLAVLAFDGTDAAAKKNLATVFLAPFQALESGFDRPAGVVIHVASSYLLFWELMAGDYHTSLISPIAAEFKSYATLSTADVAVPRSLWANYTGMDNIRTNISLNFKF